MKNKSIIFLNINYNNSGVYQAIGLMSKGFTNGLGRVISKTQKMVLDAALLNTQHYKVWIKGKVKQSKERSSAQFNAKAILLEDQ